MRAGDFPSFSTREIRAIRGSFSCFAACRSAVLAPRLCGDQATQVSNAHGIAKTRDFPRFSVDTLSLHAKIRIVRTGTATVASGGDGTRKGSPSPRCFRHPPSFPSCASVPLRSLHHSITPRANQYITNSLYYMLHGLKHGPFLGLLSLFAENRLKCPSTNDLHAKPNFSNRAQSCLIVPNQGVFFESQHPHFITPIPKRTTHVCAFREPKTPPVMSAFSEVQEFFIDRTRPAANMKPSDWLFMVIDHHQ
jgi:hypothetical protein